MGWSGSRGGDPKVEAVGGILGVPGSHYLPTWTETGRSAGKESACSSGDPDLIPAPGRSPGEGTAYTLHYSWAPLVAQLVKNPPVVCGRPGFAPWVGKIPWRRERLPTPARLPGESPWTEESGWQQAMRSQRVGHD